LLNYYLPLPVAGYKSIGFVRDMWGMRLGAYLVW